MFNYNYNLHICKYVSGIVCVCKGLPYLHIQGTICL